jgi:hypothetical protein
MSAILFEQMDGFENFCRACGITRMSVSSPVDHLGPVCAWVALFCCCVMFNVTRNFRKPDD